MSCNGEFGSVLLNDGYGADEICVRSGMNLRSGHDHAFWKRITGEPVRFPNARPLANALRFPVCKRSAGTFGTNDGIHDRPRASYACLFLRCRAPRPSGRNRRIESSLDCTKPSLSKWRFAKLFAATAIRVRDDAAVSRESCSDSEAGSSDLPPSPNHVLPVGVGRAPG